MKTITIDTVQGVGDIFWAYQKLSPYYDLIHFKILVTSADPVQQRAVDFIKLLPKVGRVEFAMVPSEHYLQVVRMRPNLPLAHAHENYAVNNWLEGGTRLDVIDPDAEVEWGVQFKLDPALKFHGNGVCMYVSGSSRHYHDKFSPQQWADLYAGLHIKQPLVLVGAEYDRWMLDAVAAELQQRGIVYEMFIGQPAEQVIALLRDAQLMIGFQSGLNVIANNYGVPVLMVDFNHLRPMARSWCRPGVPFWGFVFEDGVDGILNGLREQGFWSEP